MNCPVCGRTTNNENANFCENCGTSFRNMDSTPDNYREKENTAATIKKQEQKVIPFRTFLGVMLLPIIPMVGPFIYIAVLFFWSFGKQSSETQKNYARATLVFLVISLFFMVYAINSGLVALP